MFADASSLVAILLGEDDGPALSARLEASARRTTSAIALFETVLALRRVLKISIGDALHAVNLYIQRARMDVLPISSEAHQAALAAFQQYGKGTGSRAGLNLADCFAYACAKEHGLRLLYRGDDFKHIDLG